MLPVAVDGVTHLVIFLLGRVEKELETMIRLETVADTPDNCMTGNDARSRDC